ncbi:MAG TPA: hypothetical protein VH639_06825 [Bryobacteraceae bacterium]
MLAGIGAIAIPGVGPLIAAGPIMALLAGAGAGGAVGTLIGALVGMGIPEYEAERYEGRRGRRLIGGRKKRQHATASRKRPENRFQPAKPELSGKKCFAESRSIDADLVA